MAYSLLILLTAIYLIRPSEWVPSLDSVPLFQLTIIPCIALSIEAWSKNLTVKSLRRSPISLCVLGLLIIAVLSQLLNAPDDFETTLNFSKACVFYLLIISIITSEQQLRTYVKALGGIILLLALLMIFSPQNELLAQGGVRAEALGGKSFDPNDTAAILALGVLIFMHCALVTHGAVRRLLWIVPAVVIAHALKLTDSRGGFLALCVGVMAYIALRWRLRGIILGICLLTPIALVFATNRMVESRAVTEGTGQARIQLWHSGFVLFDHNPLFGIGPNQFIHAVGQASHNSFVQSYAELGFVGGTFFVGAFYLAAIATYRRAKTAVENPLNCDEADHLPALLFSLLAGYSMGIFALNHLYDAGTYMVLAIAASASSLKREFAGAGDDDTKHFALSVIIASIVFLIFIYVAAKGLVNW